jgi:histone H3/H4
MYVSDAAITKMLRDAGASRISKDAKRELRKYVDKVGFEVAQKAVKLSKHAKRKTIVLSDIKLATD